MNKPESSLMVLVPREPTRAMLAAADEIIDADPYWLAHAYRAMLAASPQAVPSEQPTAEQPNSHSVYLGSAGPSEDLQTALPEGALDAENQWLGDMMILQVLADSEHVNEQEREVLTRWMESSSLPPGESAGAQPSDKKYLPPPPPAASLPVSAPAGQEDARDAKRYRALRQQGGPGAKLFVRGAWSGYLGDYRHLIGEELDAAIDAMSATTKEN